MSGAVLSSRATLRLSRRQTHENTQQWSTRSTGDSVANEHGLEKRQGSGSVPGGGVLPSVPAGGSTSGNENGGSDSSNGGSGGSSNGGQGGGSGNAPQPSASAPSVSAPAQQPSPSLPAQSAQPQTQQQPVQTSQAAPSPTQQAAASQQNNNNGGNGSGQQQNNGGGGQQGQNNNGGGQQQQNNNGQGQNTQYRDNNNGQGNGQAAQTQQYQHSQQQGGNNNNGGNGQGSQGGSGGQTSSQQQDWQQSQSSQGNGNNQGNNSGQDQAGPTSSASGGDVDHVTSTSTLAPDAAATSSVTRGIAAVPADGSVATASDGSDDSVFAGSASSTGHSGIGAGGVAGIVIALLVVAAILAGFLIRRRKKQKSRAVQEMSEYLDGPRASFLAVPGQAGFTSFRDNASTRSSLPGFDMYPGPAATLTVPAPETPDDDDASRYSSDDRSVHHDDREEYDLGNHGRMASSIQNQSYYTANGALSPSSRSVRMPEYSLPSPPIPSLEREEFIYNGNGNGSNRYLSASGGGYLERSGSQRSVASQRSYVDDQLKDLYVGHY